LLPGFFNLKYFDYICLSKTKEMSIKHLTPRSTEELEMHEKSLFSGRLLRDMSYDELYEIIHLVNPAWNRRITLRRQAVKAKFQRGQVVRWSSRDGKEHQGTIIRLNCKSASVREIYAPRILNMNAKWNISYNLLF